MTNITLILLFLSASNLLLAVYHLSTRHASPIKEVYSYRGHDYPPTFPLPSAPPSVLLTVEESLQYPLLGNESDVAWFALAGSAFGYVRLGPQSPEKCHPSSPACGSTHRQKPQLKRMFVVTMFHELHCLRLLNLAFNERHQIVGDHHVKHCLGYLRQMAMCDADLTPEPAGWEDRFKGGRGGDREGATHVCRDWRVVYEAVEENWREWVESR